MAKPIFIIKIPFASATQEILLNVQRSAEEKLTDYHCIAVATGVVITEFQCFNCGDFDEMEFDELKQFVMNMVK